MSVTVPKPRKVIIDTDPGVDDVLAILLALASPEIDVTLLSIVFGNTHAPVAHANLLKIYHLLAREVEAFPKAAERFVGYTKGEQTGIKGQGRGKTRLAVGGDGPVGGEKAVAAYFHGKDGLSNLSESHPEFTPPALAPGMAHEYLDMDDRPSWEVMLETLVQEEDGSVIIIALGPLTNIAQALRLNPTALSRAAAVIWMGATLEHPGNTSATAEFNCFADPFAAAEVIAGAKQGLLKLVIAPLDITTPHQVPFGDLIHPTVVEAARKAHHHHKNVAVPLNTDGQASQLANGSATAVINPPPVPVSSAPKQAYRTWSEKPTPIEAFVSAMLLRVRGLQASFGLPDAMEMHDPVAVWYALAAGGTSGVGAGPEGLDGWGLRQRDFQVERIGELTRGMCVVDRRGTGEGSGEDRTKGELAKGEELDSGSDSDEAEADDVVSKKRKVEKGRMGEDLVTSSHLPYVITKTPGKEVLRDLLLRRIFGYEG